MDELTDYIVTGEHPVDGVEPGGIVALDASERRIPGLVRAGMIAPVVKKKGKTK